MIKPKSQSGVVMIQVIIAIGIFVILAIAVMGIATLVTRVSLQSERRTVALGIAMERIEQVRLLDYTMIGFVNGSLTDANNPFGIYQRSKTLQRNNQTYTILMDVRIVDDTRTASTTRDYKIVRVAVQWRTPGGNQTDISLVTYSLPLVPS
jgi:hypothetical protein